MVKTEYLMQPADIEKESFAIIARELGAHAFAPEELPVVMRAIHTSADFDYKENLVFSEGAIQTAKQALQEGATIVTDTQMALAGINKKALAQLGARAVCFMAEADVAQEAKARGVTRAAVSMEHAAKLSGNLLFAIGNAPTALIVLDRLIREQGLAPKLVVGVPVGFVNVVESKELFVGGDTPHIIARGRKGGSNIAAAIINAILYQCTEREGF